MRSKFRPAAVALVLVAALAATGCAPEPAAPHTPAPTSTPLFASDEEALAAAEEAYAAYLAAVDQVLQGGGLDPTPLNGVARGDAFDGAIADASEFQAMGLRTVGTTQLGNVRLQSYNARADSDGVIIRAYVCEDVSQVDLLDRDGKSLVSPDRPALTPFQVAFVETSASAHLLVSERTVWTETSECA